MIDEDPVDVSAVLRRLLRHLKRPDPGVMTTMHLRWKEIVGERLGDASAPASLVDGRLTVTAHNNSAAQELDWVRADLVETLCGLFGAGTVTEVRVRVVRGKPT